MTTHQILIYQLTSHMPRPQAKWPPVQGNNHVSARPVSVETTWHSKAQQIEIMRIPMVTLLYIWAAAHQYARSYGSTPLGSEQTHNTSANNGSPKWFHGMTTHTTAINSNRYMIFSTETNLFVVAMSARRLNTLGWVRAQEHNWGSGRIDVFRPFDFRAACPLKSQSNKFEFYWLQ